MAYDAFDFHHSGGVPAGVRASSRPRGADESAGSWRWVLFGRISELGSGRILDAYGDHLSRNLGLIADLSSKPDLLAHFGDSRLEFYSAESLRVFSRDTLPPGEFEKLQEEIHSGIRDEIRAHHPDGYRRVVAVVKTARPPSCIFRSPLTVCLRRPVCV